jgi:hypothetical protein
MADRAVPIPALPNQSPLQVRPLRGVPPRLYPVRERENDIQAFSLNELRLKIRQNRLSFPAQVPTFVKHDRPDVQRKAVQLYFLFGWSCQRIAERHGLLRQRIQQILSTWKRRAIQMGYIQEIPPAMPSPSASPLTR